MGAAVDINVLLRFLLRTLGVFVIIFLLAVLTPKIAKIVDKWIAKYRRDHDPRRDESYGIRSIYELPPRSETEDVPAGETGDVPDAGQDTVPDPLTETPAEETVPWFKR